jgi:hypothetical protein
MKTFSPSDPEPTFPPPPPAVPLPPPWPPWYPPPPTYPQPRQGTNGLAVASLVLGILGIWPLAIPFGHIGHRHASRRGQGGKGLAIAGFVLGYVGLALTVLIVVIAVAASGSVDTNVVEQFVRSDLASSVTGFAGAPSDETVDVQNVGCVQATGNTWTCDVTYHVSAPAENLSQNYSAALDVTCDSTGRCSWPSFTAIPTH